MFDSINRYHCTHFLIVISEWINVLKYINNIEIRSRQVHANRILFATTTLMLFLRKKECNDTLLNNVISDKTVIYAKKGNTWMKLTYYEDYAFATIGYSKAAF